MNDPDDHHMSSPPTCLPTTPPSGSSSFDLSLSTGRSSSSSTGSTPRLILPLDYDRVRDDDLHHPADLRYTAISGNVTPGDRLSDNATTRHVEPKSFSHGLQPGRTAINHVDANLSSPSPRTIQPSLPLLPRTPSPRPASLHHLPPTNISPGPSGYLIPHSPRYRSPLHRSRSTTSSSSDSSDPSNFPPSNLPPAPRPTRSDHPLPHRPTSPYNTSTPDRPPLDRDRSRPERFDVQLFTDPGRRERPDPFTPPRPRAGSRRPGYPPRLLGIQTSSDAVNSGLSRKRYSLNGSRSGRSSRQLVAVNWPPPGFASFLKPSPTSAGSPGSPFSRSVGSGSAGLLASPFQVAQPRANSIASVTGEARGPTKTGIDFGPELDTRRASLPSGLIQEHQRAGWTPSVLLPSLITLQSSTSSSTLDPQNASRRPSLVGWNEPFVKIRRPDPFTRTSYKDEENQGETNHRKRSAMHGNLNQQQIPSREGIPIAGSASALGKRRVSDLDHDDLSQDRSIAAGMENAEWVRRRGSQIGPYDPVPPLLRSRTTDGAGFVRPNPVSQQRPFGPLSYPPPRNRTYSWTDNADAKFVGGPPVRTVRSRSDGRQDESAQAAEGGRVSLPGIKELFVMAGEVEAGRPIPASRRRTSGDTDPSSSSYSYRDLRNNSSGSYIVSTSSSSTAPSLYSSSTFRDSVGSSSFMTPGTGSFDWQTSDRESGSLSDLRKGSWHPNLPYSLERRTMGLGLDDSNLSSLREDISDGEPEMDMDMPEDGIPSRPMRRGPTALSRNGSNSSVLGVKGLIDGLPDYGRAEDVPRPYTVPSLSTPSIYAPSDDAQSHGLGEERSWKRRKASPPPRKHSDGSADTRTGSDPLDKGPAILRPGIFGRSESTPHLNLREYGLTRPTLPPLGSMTSFSSIRSTVGTPSESGASRYSQGLFGQSTRLPRDSTPLSSAMPTPLTNHISLRGSSPPLSTMSADDPESRGSSPLRAIDDRRSESMGHYGMALPGIASFVDSPRPNVVEAPGSSGPLFPHHGPLTQQSTLPLPDVSGRRASLSTSNLEATASLGIPHGVVLTADEVSRDKSGAPGVGPRYGCDFCGKTFSRPSSLKIHIYTHTGEKPYICDWPHCHRQFSVQSNLKRHAKVHYEAAAALAATKHVVTNSRPHANRHEAESLQTQHPHGRNSIMEDEQSELGSPIRS